MQSQISPGHDSWPGDPTQGASRRQGRRAVAVLRRSRVRAGGSQAGAAPADRCDGPGSGRVPHDASPQARAADLDAAFGDPAIRAVLATIGGADQIAVIPYLHPELVQADPNPFLGYSDNPNLLNWLRTHGVAGVSGGAP